MNTSETFGNIRRVAPPSSCPPLLTPPTLGPKNQISPCSRNITAAFTANCWTITVNIQGKIIQQTHWTFSAYFHRLYPKAASFWEACFQSHISLTFQLVPQSPVHQACYWVAFLPHITTCFKLPLIKHALPAKSDSPKTLDPSNHPLAHLLFPPLPLLDSTLSRDIKMN